MGLFSENLELLRESKVPIFDEERLQVRGVLSLEKVGQYIQEKLDGKGRWTYSKGVPRGNFSSIVTFVYDIPKDQYVEEYELPQAINDARSAFRFEDRLFSPETIINKRKAKITFCNFMIDEIPDAKLIIKKG